MISIEDGKIRRRFLFLNSLRITIYSVLILISIFILVVFRGSSFPNLAFIISLLVALIFSFLNFSFFKTLRHKFVIYIQLFIDIIIITLIVYFSGGISSPFYFLYILPIIVSSIFLTKRDTFYIAALSFIFFGILSDLMYVKIIPFYSGIYPISISFGSFIYNIIMSFVAFLTVAIISSYYFENIKKIGEELKSTQENLKDLTLLNNTVMEKMENGFITCDSDGKIISYNKKSKILLNLDTNYNIFESLFLESDLVTLKRELDSNNKYYFEKEINNFFLGISVSFIKGIYSFDKIFVFIITDLTEKKGIEEALNKKEHLALIGEMAAGIAHEIRNPLASISGAVQFLEKELKLKTENKNLMDIIVKESSRLSKSVEEFLDFTKITPLEKSEFDLAIIIDEMLELIKLNIKKVRFIKKYSKGNKVFADVNGIKQLIWNLVNNSIKAVNYNGVVQISIYDEIDRINLSIKDNGIGIEKKELSKIFIPFYSKFSSGIGLGMAVVKRIIEEHNFDIKINSKKNIGTEVIVCFEKM